jgi:hypothetical protein
MALLPHVLFGVGVAFLLINLHALYQFVRFLTLRSSAILTWPGRRPPLYRLFLVVGAILAVLIVYKLVALRHPPTAVFGESMMLVYYVWAMPLTTKIGRGFYEDGIWVEGGFIPYSHIGGLQWREEEQPTLVVIYRMRHFARRLVVPEGYYGAVRRLLRDKIAAHDIQFPEKALDLGAHDERDDV